MDNPEICVKHKFIDAETQTKDVFERQTQLQNAVTCEWLYYTY